MYESTKANTKMKKSLILLILCLTVSCGALLAQISTARPSIDSLNIMTRLAVTYKLQRDNAQGKYLATADTLDKVREEIQKTKKRARRGGFKKGLVAGSLGTLSLLGLLAVLLR